MIGAERKECKAMSERDYWFISYSSKDSSVVEEIINLLISCGITYWKAPEMIPAGSNYAKEIPKAIHDCSVVLFVVSQASQESIWVEKEIDIAIGYRKKIIPVKIDDTVLNDMYRFYLNNVQLIEAGAYDNGKLPDEVQERLRFVFAQNLGNNDEWSDSARMFAGRNNIPKVDTRSNAFRINKIPMQCEYCGTRLQDGIRGVYRCYRCGREYYDDFRKIRNFLEQNGPSPAIVIAKSTGVSMETVDYYFKDDSVGNAGQRLYENPSIEQKKDNKGLWHYNYGKNDLGNRRR